MNKYLVLAKHIGTGDNVHKVPYILITELDLDRYTKKAQKTIALLIFKQSLKFHELLITESEIFNDYFCEFSQIKSIKKINQDDMQKLSDLIQPKIIQLSESQLQDIQQTEEEVLHAVTHAQFAPKLILFNEPAVSSVEQVDEESWLFDTDCLIAQAAKFTLYGTEMMAINRQYCRLVASCKKDRLSSLVADEQFYSDFEDEKNWTLLVKASDEAFEADTFESYEIDGEQWVVYEILDQTILNEKLSQVSESLAEINTDQVNEMLDNETSQLIFERSKASI